MEANTITLESIHSELQEIKRFFLTKQPNRVEEYLTPTEVCGILKNGFLKIHKPDPSGRKIYCLRSEIQEIFSKDFK
jgi:hypothetical protein